VAPPPAAAAAALPQIEANAARTAAAAEPRSPPRPLLPTPQGAVLQLVSSVLAIEKDAPDRDERIGEVRKSINSWVAKYRRNEKFAGRPSYG
jgi:hypothetical protein